MRACGVHSGCLALVATRGRAPIRSLSVAPLSLNEACAHIVEDLATSLLPQWTLPPDPATNTDTDANDGRRAAATGSSRGPHTARNTARRYSACTRVHAGTAPADAARARTTFPPRPTPPRGMPPAGAKGIGLGCAQSFAENGDIAVCLDVDAAAAAGLPVSARCRTSPTPPECQPAR